MCSAISIIYVALFIDNKSFTKAILPPLMTILLTELRNRILHTILVWPLFRLILLFVGLYYLRILLENLFLSCFSALSLNQDIKTCIIMYVILVRYFVLTLHKNSRFINNKLFINVWQYYVKTCFQRCFDFFKKNSFIKKSAEQSQNKECKKSYLEKVSYQSFSSIYKYSIR